MACMRFITSNGVITIRFAEECDQIHLRNIINLSRIGYYNGTCFYRLRVGFVAEGGDRTLSGAAGFSSEFLLKRNGRRFLPPGASSGTNCGVGVLGMINSSRGVSSNFYFTLGEAETLCNHRSTTVIGYVTCGIQLLPLLTEGSRIYYTEVDVPLKDFPLPSPSEMSRATRFMQVVPAPRVLCMLPNLNVVLIHSVPAATSIAELRRRLAKFGHLKRLYILQRSNDTKALVVFESAADCAFFLRWADAIRIRSTDCQIEGLDV